MCKAVCNPEDIEKRNITNSVQEILSLMDSEAFTVNPIVSAFRKIVPVRTLLYQSNHLPSLTWMGHLSLADGTTVHHGLYIHDAFAAFQQFATHSSHPLFRIQQIVTGRPGTMGVPGPVQSCLQRKREENIKHILP